jgi:hypothetical protein
MEGSGESRVLGKITELRAPPTRARGAHIATFGRFGAALRSFRSASVAIGAQAGVRKPDEEDVAWQEPREDDEAG